MFETPLPQRYFKQKIHHKNNYFPKHINNYLKIKLLENMFLGNNSIRL